MNNYYVNYGQTLQRGVKEVQNLSGRGITGLSLSHEKSSQLISTLKEKLTTADAILIGAGAGVSTAAGFTYAGSRFENYFFDFKEQYGITDMYSGGFYSFPTKEIQWAWWARCIYVNRFMSPTIPVYSQLLSLLEHKNYFVLTTNVDHQFQRAGFDKKRLFYTQGDFGLFQSAHRVFENEAWVMEAMEAQGFERLANGIFQVPASKKITTSLPSSLVPQDPIDGTEVTMNLRIDSSFLEDDGWHQASKRYTDFLNAHMDKNIVLLELGVGGNTPAIIKYPFWEFTHLNPNATYCCLNLNEAFYPIEIATQSIAMNGDLHEILTQLK